MKRFDDIQEVQKHDSEAKTFEEILKFNPYHDALGRFSSANGAHSFTRFTQSAAGQKAIANIKEREKAKAQAASGGSGSGSSDNHEEKPKQPTQEPRSYKKIDNAEAESMAKEMGQTREQMPEKDYDDMTGWSGYINTGNSFSINDQLRNGMKVKDMSDSDRKACEAMDRNMKPSTQDIRVTRMTGSSMLESLGIEDVWNVGGISTKELKSLEGKVFSQEGYTSTSFDMGENVFTSRPVKMKINVPKGANMLISPTRDWNDKITEAEIILPRDCPMKVNKVTRTTGTTGDPVIELEIDVLLD